MYTKSEAISGARPPVVPAKAGTLIVADASIEVTVAQIALNALVGLMILPAGCVPIDFLLIEDDLDTGTTLVQAVGVLNGNENDLAANTNFITGATTGQAGGCLAATAMPDALIAPAAADRVIAVKTTIGAFPGVRATGIITSTGVNVSPDDTVKLDAKTYKFVAEPADEGDVDIGASAAASLDNLKLAINRTDPATNDGVNYKCAAAHPTVSATTNTDTQQTVEALLAGVAGNEIALETIAVTLSISGADFGSPGGVDGVDATPLQAGTIRGIMTYRAEEYGA